MAKQQPVLLNYQRIIFGIIFLWLLLGTMLLVIVIKKHAEQFETIGFEEGTNRLALRTYIDPVIDISENRVYIPEIKAYMPLNPTTRTLKYYYDDRSDMKKITFSTQNLVGRWSAGDGDPSSCVGVVRLSSSHTADSTMQAADPLIEPISGMGYMSTHSDCKMYKYGLSTISPADIETAVRSLKPY